MKKPPKKRAPASPPKPARGAPLPRNRRIKNVPLAPAPGADERVSNRGDGSKFWPASQVELRPIDQVVPYANNPRTHPPEQVERIAQSIREWGFTMPLLVSEGGELIAGHARLAAAKLAGLAEVPVMVARGWSIEQRRAYVIADNQLALTGGWDDVLLGQEFEALAASAFDMRLLGFEDEDLRAYMDAAANAAGNGAAGEEVPHVDLAERFLVPPFSVLSAREGWWQGRRRSWIAIGIESEVGRGDNLLRYSKSMRSLSTFAGGGDVEAADEDFSGTSIFDPVLCEIAYRWFSPPGGTVLDPFAGGSVRGVVAGKLGRKYIGVDLRAEQVEANRGQARAIFSEHARLEPAEAEELVTDPQALTPVAQHYDIWIKRDDLFDCNGARGGKARAALAILKGAKGACAAGNRLSPQLSRVARVCEHLGIPFRGHASGAIEASEPEADAIAHGAEIVKIVGTNYLTALRARAREDAEALGWTLVPFGMESREYFETTKAQVENLPEGIARIVVTAGSGMSAAAILAGLQERGRSIPILAVRVGGDPVPVLNKWAPANWREHITIVGTASTFETPEKKTRWWGIELDAHYEAKAAPFVEPGDLFWSIAKRSQATPALGVAAPGAPEQVPTWVVGDSRQIETLVDHERVDFVFSCPPYADLERYSDDERDLSTLDYAEFRDAYRVIVARACGQLREDRFACFVVGEVRDKRGHYYNFVGDTVEAFKAAGLAFYNEAILLTALGSVAFRSGRQFAASRKVGKAHQNVLVFLKGDAKRAVAACGPVDVALPEGLQIEQEDATHEHPEPQDNEAEGAPAALPRQKPEGAGRAAGA